MKVLLVIHGYPLRYNAGSENYTQNLAHGLYGAGIDVTVFSRNDNPFQPEYEISKETDPQKPDIPVILINHPRSNIRFRNENIDSIFRDVLEDLKPDIVHFGHLGHLSTGMVEQATASSAKTIFTLHDYWLMCPRGQFLEWGLTPNEPWRLCKNQDNNKCANRCFNRYITGKDPSETQDYWIRWIKERMEETRKVSNIIDYFIAPSRYILKRHIEEFGISSNKIAYLDYGFNPEKLRHRQRIPEDELVFGFIGRHHPSKGIDQLIQAFNKLKGNAKLRIWGSNIGNLTKSLKQMAQEQLSKGKCIEWLGEYQNEDITGAVFNRCDCIVVPSIWDENSPLVIHEAQQVGVPVITAAHGGMGEYVKDFENGLTYKHRDVDDLTRAMKHALENRKELVELGKRGYLYSGDGSVPSIDSHVKKLIELYQQLISPKSIPMEGVLCN